MSRTKMSKFFSAQLYIQGLKKVRAAGIATAIIIIVSNALFPITTLISELSRQSYAEYEEGYHRTAEMVGATSVSPLSIFMMFLAPLLAFSMFSFLNDRCKSDFYHSLPQRRECVFISFLAATLTWSVGSVVVSHVVNGILWALVPYHSISITTVLLSLAAFVIMTLLMTSFATLALSVTGTSISNTLITLLFALIFRIVGSIFLWAIELQSNVFLAEYSPLRYLGFGYYLPFAIFSSLVGISEMSAFSNAAMLISSLCAAILLLALSGLIYCKRRSESAGKSAPNKFIQHVWRISITLPLVLLTCALIISDGLEVYHLILLVLSLIIYLVFELMTTKKIKNMIKSIPLFAITFVVSIAVILFASAVSAVIDSQTPTPDEIEGVSIINKGYMNSYENLVISEIFAGEDEAAEIVSEALEYATGSSFSSRFKVSTSVKIKLDNGKIIARRIYLTDEERLELTTLIGNSAEVKQAYLALPSDSEITSVVVSNIYSEERMDELWECFCEEYEALTDEQKLTLKSYSADKDFGLIPEQYGGIESIASFNVYGYYKLRSFYSSYPINPSLLPKTALKYLEIFNEYQGENQTGFAELVNSLKKATLPREGGVTFDIDVRPVFDSVTNPKKGVYLGGYYSALDKNRAGDFKKFISALELVADIGTPDKFENADHVYKVTVRAYDIVVSPYSDFENGDVWYEYIDYSLYLNITDEQISALLDIINDK